MIAAALLLTGALVLFRALMKQGADERNEVILETRHKVAAVVLGSTVGFVLGLTSAGSGTLIAIGLILGFRLMPRRVVGTDVFHAAILLWVAAIAHLFSGNVDLLLTLDDPDRLAAGRLARHPPGDAPAGARPAPRARRRAARRRPRRC